MNSEPIETDREQWPAVDAAFQFVLPSYQMLMSRFEAADNRLTALLTFASSVTLGVPLIGRSLNSNASFSSPWFAGGVLFFIVGAVFGVWGRVSGTITLPNPTVLFNENLHKSEWAFKKDQIFRSGKHFVANVEAVERKGGFAFILTAALLLEVLAFVIWLAQWPAS
jgi:hypothetical protein